MGCGLSVLYHSGYLETREEDRKGSIANMLRLRDNRIRCYHGYYVVSLNMQLLPLHGQQYSSVMFDLLVICCQKLPSFDLSYMSLGFEI